MDKQKFKHSVHVVITSHPQLPNGAFSPKPSTESNRVVTVCANLEEAEKVIDQINNSLDSVSKTITIELYCKDKDVLLGHIMTRIPAQDSYNIECPCGCIQDINLGGSYRFVSDTHHLEEVDNNKITIGEN